MMSDIMFFYLFSGIVIIKLDKLYQQQKPEKKQHIYKKKMFLFILLFINKYTNNNHGVK